jgi:hypothetical protein
LPGARIRRYCKETAQWNWLCRTKSSDYRTWSSHWGSKLAASSACHAVETAPKSTRAGIRPGNSCLLDRGGWPGATSAFQSAPSGVRWMIPAAVPQQTNRGLSTAPSPPTDDHANILRSGPWTIRRDGCFV